MRFGTIPFNAYVSEKYVRSIDTVVVDTSNGIERLAVVGFTQILALFLVEFSFSCFGFQSEWSNVKASPAPTKVATTMRIRSSRKRASMVTEISALYVEAFHRGADASLGDTRLTVGNRNA